MGERVSPHSRCAPFWLPSIYARDAAHIHMHGAARRIISQLIMISLDAISARRGECLYIFLWAARVTATARWRKLCDSTLLQRHGGAEDAAQVAPAGPGRRQDAPKRRLGATRAR
jgi:hypothetical protein